MSDRGRFSKLYKCTNRKSSIYAQGIPYKHIDSLWQEQEFIYAQAPTGSHLGTRYTISYITFLADPSSAGPYSLVFSRIKYISLWPCFRGSIAPVHHSFDGFTTQVTTHRIYIVSSVNKVSMKALLSIGGR